MKHTLGPWKYTKTNDGFLVEDLSGQNYVSDCGMHFQAEANARLIAAAPDLLESIELIMGYAKAGAISNEIGKQIKLNQIITSCEVAIRKAEGR